MKLKNNLILRNIGSDYIIIDPEKGSLDMTKVFSFNQTAAWLWEKLKGVDFTEDHTADLLVEKYDVEKEQALIDVRVFIDVFREYNLLAVE